MYPVSQAANIQASNLQPLFTPPVGNSDDVVTESDKAKLLQLAKDHGEFNQNEMHYIEETLKDMPVGPINPIPDEYYNTTVVNGLLEHDANPTIADLVQFQGFLKFTGEPKMEKIMKWAINGIIPNYLG